MARPWTLSCLVLSLSLAATTARADEATAKAAARSLGSDGIILADQGRCADAIPKLERAEKLYHAPTTAGRLGECFIETGKLVVGTELLQRLLREPAGPDRPPAFVEATARARKVLDSALPRIANIHITVQAPPGTKIKLSIDGEALSEAFLDIDSPIDPGTHTVRASAPGFLPASSHVRMSDGETVKVALKLERDPSAPTASDAAERYEPATPAKSGSRAPAFVAFGVGALGLGAGAVAGALAQQHASSAEGMCPNKACVAGSDGERELDAAKSMATISTTGFVIGGVGLVVGAVLLLVRPGSSVAAAPAGLRGTF